MLGQGRVRSLSSRYFSSRVRMMEKAALPEKRQKGEAHHSGLRHNFHMLPLPASGKTEMGEEKGLAQMKFCAKPLAGRTSTRSLFE